MQNAIEIVGQDRAQVKTLRAARSHGYARNGPMESKTYRTWANMKGRCLNPKNKDFKNYGARGISVCESWMKFENFLADMGDSPQGMSLDRIDNSLGYFKANCRWATKRDQENNTRRSVLVSFNGRSQTVAQWEHEYGFKKKEIRSRLRRGWTMDNIIRTALVVGSPCAPSLASRARIAGASP